MSARAWADWWLHEGFGAYAHAVFVDVEAGRDRYLEYMRKYCRAEAIGKFRNPVIRGTDRMAEEAYVPEVYSKASCVLHTLRWLVGDDDFYAALHRLLNDEAFAYRTVSTADFRRLVAGVTGHPYDWFFDRYLYEASIPAWRLERAVVEDGEVVTLSWDDPLFELPIPLRVAGELLRLEMPGGQGSLRVPAGSELIVDPDGWLLAVPAPPPATR